MKQEERKITIGAVKTLRHHRKQLDRKIREVEGMLTGRDHPLLPENWTDDDAWELAGELAKLTRLIAQVDHTVFDERNPYPGDDVLMEDIPYYNPFDDGPEEFVCEDGEVVQNLSLPETIDRNLGLWTEVLHCAILVAAGTPEFCFPSGGTFADLKELLTGNIRTDAGPEIMFDAILADLRTVLSRERYRELEKDNFGPEPPTFRAPKTSEDEWTQEDILRDWEEWTWLNSYPHRDELRQAIERVHSTVEFHDRVMHFIHWYLYLNDLLSPVIDLYLYQTGASGMLDNSFYVTYAMLCHTQKQIKAAMTEMEEG